MKSFRRVVLASTAMALCATGTAHALDVVASIKPVHSLVAAVMEGVGEPDLLVRGAGSPHTYSLRPSEAAMLERADVVFWVGPDLEMFLSGALTTLASNATVVELSESEGLTRLEFREGGPFESHTHGDDDHGHAHDDHGHADHGHAHDDDGHDDDGHDDHAHDDHGHDHEDAAHAHDDDGHDDDGHDDHAHDDHGHDHEDAAHAHDDDGHDDDGHDDHAHDDHGHDHEDAAHAHDDDGHDDDGHDDHAHHGAYDMHMWLDPENAKVFVGEIVSALSAADPDNAATFAENGEALQARLDELSAEVDAALADVRGRDFVVFHDAYQYYENRFGITAAGSITVSPEVMPGAARIEEIRTRIQELEVACVFAEPQFEPRLVEVVTEGTPARAGVLDPLGAELDDGQELYFELIRNLTTSLAECLQG
ncbi:zinc ABC transporter solute-binding protein [Chelativorans sp. ZYF759]|uniref:zinc ABC transporter substrate-binding protein n=1 Tax=Chelativorans sp. ZYF759 TaxID=2692213 RepID=UPI00145E3BE8|nr:zinc ABC transporter substrate-binding protein [Chelativorans sp. ZYF759]NMG40992.1 zinc ABC transporter solute-binding protein [Chelativorans sp. ZYF759]